MVYKHNKLDAYSQLEIDFTNNSNKIFNVMSKFVENY